MELDKVWLITGATGQDASILFDLLLEMGYTNLHGTMRRSATFNTKNIDHIFDKLKLHYCDLTDAMNINSIISKCKPDYIINTAAQSHVAVGSEIENYTIQVNTLGVLHILQSVKSLGLNTKIYQCGTSEEFGNETNGDTFLNENSPKIPVSIYGISKLAAENICNIYRDAYGMFIVTGTLFNHESCRRGGTFVTKKITNYVAEKKFVKPLQLGNLDAKRDWSHAIDMCRGIILMLLQDTPKNYVLSSNETHSVREFIELAFKQIGITIYWEGNGINEIGYNKYTRQILVTVDEKYYRPIDIECLLGDSSKARNELGWYPEYDFEDIVKDMMRGSLKKKSFFDFFRLI